MRLLALAAAMLLSTAPAQAEPTWTPNKPIKLIVTYAPGGSADVLARLMQDPMSKALGVPIVVENRAGAGGNIGTQAVARAEPDGYTIGIGAASTHAINPTLFGPKLPFRVPQDFTPIGQILSQPNVLLVSLDTPVKTPAEFVAWMKANPGTSFGTAGVGSTNHLTGELINLRYGIKMAHTPYKSGGQALNDLMGGHVKIVVDNITTAAVLAKNNQARAIAVSTLKRVADPAGHADLRRIRRARLRAVVLAGPVRAAEPAAPVLQRLHAAMMAALAESHGQDAPVRIRLRAGRQLAGRIPGLHQPGAAEVGPPGEGFRRHGRLNGGELMAKPVDARTLKSWLHQPGRNCAARRSRGRAVRRSRTCSTRCRCPTAGSRSTSAGWCRGSRPRDRAVRWRRGCVCGAGSAPAGGAWLQRRSHPRRRHQGLARRRLQAVRRRQCAEQGVR